MIINHNIPSINATRQIRSQETAFSKSLERLSSGLRINRAADDAAGLSISSRMRAQVRSQHQAFRNTQDGISLIQTAESAMKQINNMLQRLRELSLQASNETLTANDRAMIQKEFTQILAQIDTIASQTEFNTSKLLDGSSSIMASSSSDLLQVIVDNANIPQQINPTQEGRYRVHLETEAGQGQVQGSNIFRLTNGTRGENVDLKPDGGEHSGLQSLNATGLAPGDYRIETRETPFGNIYYLDSSGNNTEDPATDLGLNSVSTSSSPRIMPPGRFDIITAGTVPFMATFEDKMDPEEIDIIEGVAPTNRNGIDVEMDIMEQNASDAETEVCWKDFENSDLNISAIEDLSERGSEEIALEIKPDFDTNMYTYFNVTGEGERMRLDPDNEINIHTYYHSHANSLVEMELTYKTETDSEIQVEATYTAAAGEAIQLKTTETLEEDELVITLEMDNNGAPDEEITIDGLRGLDIQQAKDRINDRINEELNGHDINLSLQVENGERYIEITNNIPDRTISFGGAAAAELGVETAELDDGESTSTRNMEFEKQLDINVGGASIEGVADALHSELQGYDINVSTEPDGNSIRNLTINNDGNFRLEIDKNSSSVISELGLYEMVNGDEENLMIGPDETWDEGSQVYHNHSFTINTGNMNLYDLASEISDEIIAQDTINSVDGLNIDVDTVNTSKRKLDIENNSIYSLEFEDTAEDALAELGLDSTLARGQNEESITVFHEYKIEVGNLGNLQIDNISENLNDALNNCLDEHGDVLGTGNSDIFTLEDGDNDDERRISIDNATHYKITVEDRNDSELAGELGIQEAIGRNDTISGNSLDFGKLLDTIGDEADLEEIKSAIEDMHEKLSVNWLDDEEPSQDNGWRGHIEIVNSDDENNRLEFEFKESNSNEQLFSGGSISITPGQDEESKEWLTRDWVEAEITFDGITRDGNINLDGEIDGHIIWRGENTTFSETDDLPFTSIYITEAMPDQGGLTEDDNWAMYTKAQVDDPHTVLDFRLRDINTSITYAWGSDNSGGRYAFTAAGINNLESGSYRRIPQLLKGIGDNDPHLLEHRINFGSISEATAAVVYNQRYSDSGYDHYSHAYYGDETTYFFEGGGASSNYLQDISVWRQNEINASLLFTSMGDDQFRVEGHGYHRDGSLWTLEPETFTLGSGPVNIGGIQFDQFNLGSDIRQDDKFVVNVAARAGEGQFNYSSDSNIKVTGNPWNRGSSMEYRFASGAEDGQELELLGYFVDPVLGADDDLGVWNGRINLDVGESGFHNLTRTNRNQRSTLEVNYMGTTEPIASSLLTGYHFQDMQEDENYRHFIDEIEYDPESMKNASLMLEVVENKGANLIVRAQAHIYHRDGRYEYAFDDYISISERNRNLTFFGECGAELNFSQFNLEDITRFKKGDRLSLGLAANGQPQGSDIDEVYLWSSAYGRDIFPHTWRFDDKVLDYANTSLHTYQIDYHNGDVYDSTIALTFADYHGGPEDGIGTPGSTETPQDIQDTARFTSQHQESRDMGIAHRYSKLRDIDLFYSNSGAFLLDNPAQLEIWHQGQTESVTIYGDDTIMNMLDRIDHAMYRLMGDEMGVEEENRYKFASFVNTLTGRGNLEMVEGSMVLRSAQPGQDGEFLFQGSEDILKALGLSAIRESEENQTTINAVNLDTGQTVIEDKTVHTGSTAMGMLQENVGFRIDPSLGIYNTEYDRCQEDFAFITSEENNKTVYIRIMDNSKLLQTGANPGQVARIRLGDFSTQSLGLSSLTVLNKEEAANSVRQVDQAIQHVTSHRSQLGALQNRLEHTMDNLMVASENLSHAESRIRDADMAQEMMDFAKQTVIMNSAQQVLAQTNMQPMAVLVLIEQNLNLA